MRNWLVFKDLCCILYHDLLFVTSRIARIVMIRHETIIHIGLLMVQIYLTAKLIAQEHRIYEMLLLGQ